MAELVSVKRLGWSPYLGQWRTLKSLTILGRYPVRVQDFWVPATEAFEEALIATGYEDPCDYTGSYMKRKIAGTNLWSWHSYGGAIDLDYGYRKADRLVDKNPHLHRRIVPGDAGFGVEFQLTEVQVREVESIRTGNGRRVWRWLGWAIGDTMHFEPACSPEDARSGIVYGSVPPLEDDMGVVQDGLKAQTMAWYEALQDKTGSPGGSNPGYWGSDYAGAGPNEAEWDAATDELFAAALKAGVLGPFPVSDSGVDVVARGQASRANTRLDGIDLNVPG